MSGDWIKMRSNLWDDPRVSRLCELTDLAEGPVIGALYWLWATADQHTEDGRMPGLTLRQIDRKTGIAGFGAALCEIEWLRDDPGGVVLVDFDDHNGASAKKRCQTAKRVANSRSANADVTPTALQNEHKSDTGALAREEKRREEGNTASSDELARARRPDDPQLSLVGGTGQKPASSIPDCPHAEVLALWAEVLPALPQHDPEQWKGARADHLRARWRETAVAKGWIERAEGMTYMRRLFGYVGQSHFLTGRAPPGAGKRPFFVELEWLVKPINWAKVIEGKYHTEAA